MAGSFPSWMQGTSCCVQGPSWAPGPILGVSERALDQARAQGKHCEVLSFQGPNSWDVDVLGVVQELWNHRNIQVGKDL